jgi:phage-related protein (TIGR01555 family)
LINWFRKLHGNEIVETDASPIVGVTSTDYRPKSRIELAMNIQSQTIQIEAPNISNGAMDAYNITGQNVTDNQFAFYGSQGFIGYQTMAMLGQNWLISKACSQVGKDAVRKGWTITANEINEEIIEYVKELDKRYKIVKQLKELSHFSRLFGIRHAMAVIDSDDPEFYEKPFNPDGIKAGSYRGITQVDPYWISPLLTNSNTNDPASIYFYDPDFWQVSGKKIHRSHLIIIKGDEVPDILKPTYRYGGLSVTQKIFERVYCAERTANEAPQLAQTKRETILKTDVDKALSNQAMFDIRMTQWANARDNYGVRMIGLDDEMSQIDTSLADLDSVIMTQYQLVASIAGMPVTKLLGTVPKGFNATGEYDEAMYHEELENHQSDVFMPLLDRHYQCLVKSSLVSKFGIDCNLNVTFNPLDALTTKEQAEVNDIKARTALTLSQVGAIDGIDERERLRTDDKSGYAHLEDAELEDDETVIDEQTY